MNHIEAEYYIELAARTQLPENRWKYFTPSWPPTSLAWFIDTIGDLKATERYLGMGISGQELEIMDTLHIAPSQVDFLVADVPDRIIDSLEEEYEYELRLLDVSMHAFLIADQLPQGKYKLITLMRHQLLSCDDGLPVLLGLIAPLLTSHGWMVIHTGDGNMLDADIQLGIPTFMRAKFGTKFCAVTRR
jgi:hypothetical protein